MPDTETHSLKTTTCFNWARLLLSATLPMILGIFTIVFTLQQNSISYANREQDRLHAIKLRQQAIYDSYINTISNLLLSKSFNRTDQHQLNHIGFKTVDVLQHLSLDQKRDMILFLYSHELNRRDKATNQRVILSGADLANVHFVQSTSTNCDLRYVSLAYILAPKIVFERCDINFAGFEHASLVDAKFVGSLLQSAKFYKANLTGVVFHEGNLHQVDFSHAILVNTKFSGVISGEINFTNADLLHSDLSNEYLYSSQKKNIIVNTRLPNGSFSAVSKSNLIVDGGAEEACVAGRYTPWYPFAGHQLLDLYNKTHSETTIPRPISGECYFYKLNSSRMYQVISPVFYSLLINAGIAYFNFSAYMGCTIANRNDDRVLIDIRCWNDYFDGDVCGKLRISKNASDFQYQTTTGLIPKGTAYFRVWVETIISAPSTSNDSIVQACFADDIQLSIFKKEK